ncbi:MAG TPA: YcnI family protein [Mycobacterium sp.]|nr:YcnI family protein [Mycobacterium sp.]
MGVSFRIVAPRVLAAAAAMLCASSVTGLTPARAHVHASSPGAVRGNVAMVTFEVPNESQNGSATIELTVTLPNVTSVYTETKPGWTAQLDRNPDAGTVMSVNWKATAGAGIEPYEFDLFRISMKLPDADTVHFPAAQRYADGTVVRWDQLPLPGGGEPERPAPALTLAAGPVAPPEHHAPPEHPAPSVSAAPAPANPTGPATVSTDNAARLLAGAALLLAALGVTVAIVRGRT